MDKSDKNRVNNEIISLRKVVKKVKVHIIHKLVRNVKNLKKRAAKKEVESFQKKIDRLLEELSEIKKLAHDEISKFALSNKKEPGEILTNTQSSGKERAFARFCAHKIIMEQTDKIKAEYPNLDDLLCSLQKHGLKKKKKPMKKNSAKYNKTDDLSFSSGGSLLRIKKADTDYSDNSSIKVINENLSQNSKNESYTDSETDDRFMNTNIQMKPLSLNSLGKNIPSSEHQSKKRKKNTDDGQNKKPKTEIDSFFLTDKGEYESCIVKDAGSPEPSNKIKQHKTFGKNGNFQSKASWKGQTPRETNFSKKKFNEKSFQPKGGRNNKYFNKEKGQPVQISLPNKIEKIHPSWEAKKKDKEKQQSIYLFQGKKKTFDDE